MTGSHVQSPLFMWARFKDQLQRKRLALQRFDLIRRPDAASIRSRPRDAVVSLSCATRSASTSKGQLIGLT